MFIGSSYTHTHKKRLTQEAKVN
uniref:Uncharacterized protein n=1 Tax=Anguilla anguilla TaxID=7936 RepID=A0A0E9T6Q4_ANGAN